MAAGALCAIADDDPALVVVTGRDPGVAAAFAERHPHRHVLAPGAGTRPAVADGLARAGKLVVTLGDDFAGRRVPARLGDVLLTRDASTAAAARAAGVVVVVPAWPADVEPLLRAALAADVPVCYLLHDGPVPEEAAPTPPLLGRPRVLRSGERALVAAAGAGVAVLEPVARMLAGRGVRVTAVAVHTLARGDGWPAALLDGHLVVATGAATLGATGRPSAPLQAVPVGDGVPRTVMERVLALLPATP